MTKSDVRRGRWLTSVAAGCASALVLTACGGGGDASDGGGGDGDDGDGRLPVVASTNVWASVVSAVGGEHVEVTSVIDDPSADPHSYEADAADAAEVQSAEALIYNGGGYDDFFARLAERAPDVPTVVAVDAATSDAGGERSGDHETGAGHEDGHEDGHGGHEGHDHASGNEHVWYDLAAVGAVAERVADALGKAAPQQRKVFEDNAATFTARLDELSAEVDALAERHGGGQVAATAPLADYLLTDAGLEDLTPQEFSAAVENETDVPVAAQQRMLELMSGREVGALVRNAQTPTPATEKVVEAARNAGVPVVDLTETLPGGQDDYIAWMSAQVDALSGALAG